MQIATTSPAAVGVAAPKASLSPGAIAAFLIAALLLASTVVALRKDVREGFDELAHVSYVADLQRMHTAWPALDRLRMLDPHTFMPTAEPSYINHPPVYYLLLAHLGPAIDRQPVALVVHRLINVTLAALGFCALLLLVQIAALARLEALALVAPLVMIPVLPAIAGAVNNDNAAFAAGALALCGLYGLIAAGSARWLLCALAGVVLAGAAKLNALMLTGGMVLAAFGYLTWRGRFRARWVVPTVLAFAIAATPYLVFIAQYGSPAPNSAGQQMMLEQVAREAGWFDQDRLPFWRYLAYFAAATIERWAPALQTASAYATGALIIPLATICAGLAGLAVSVQRLVRRREGAREVIVIAGWMAIAATLVLHVAFSYERHLATGWLLDTYPRYYIALFAIVPLSAMVLMSSIPEGRWRNVFACALILSPLLLNLIGSLPG